MILVKYNLLKFLFKGLCILKYSYVNVAEWVNMYDLHAMPIEKVLNPLELEAVSSNLIWMLESEHVLC